MICKKITLPNGVTAIACMARGRPKKCACGAPSTLFCDFPKAEGRTCDKPLCRKCAVSVGPDLDHCRDHPKKPPAQFTLELDA